LKEKKFSVFKVFIIVLVIIVGLESLLIFRSVFDIKSGNNRLRSELDDLKKMNRILEEENKTLKLRIADFQNPEVAPPEVHEGYQVYRNLDFGYEIAYPAEYKITLSSGHSPEDNPEQDQKLAVYPKDSSIRVDINAINAEKYKGISEYIKEVYNYKIYVKESIYINNIKYDIYKLAGDKHYYAILKGKRHIIDVNSSSEELLIKVLGGFKFI
jgi:hypothetical protein